jgi:iron-sulfur cluster assembly protein
MFNVSPDAIKHILFYAGRENKEPILLVTLQPSGCSGYKYKIEWATDSMQSNSLLYESNFVKIYSTHQVGGMLEGATLIFKKDGLNEGFDFVNPNEVARCGCGQSVNLNANPKI